MGLATIVGGLVAYPINYWLVKNHLKHGCMTLPGRDQPAPCLGHCSPECPTTSRPATPMDMDMDMKMPEGHQSHEGNGGHEGHEGHGMHMQELPWPRAAGIMLLTFLFLAAAIAATSQFVPIEF